MLGGGSQAERPKKARRRGLLTLGIVGYDGGRIVGERLAGHAVVVRSGYIPRIQEVQASIYHVLRVLIEQIRVEGRPSST